MALYIVTARQTAVALVLAGSIASCGGSDRPSSAEDGGSGAGGQPSGVILDGGGAIPRPPDGPSLCAPGACNYQTQSGCAMSESCVPMLNGSSLAPGCLGAGTQQLGAACSDWSDCARGLFCVEQICRKPCCGGDWTACPTGQSCIRQLLIRDPATNRDLDARVDLCFPVGTCDVLDPASCAGVSGRSCQIVDPLGNVACAPLGRAALGEPCTPAQNCVQGMSCVDDHCRRLCRAVAGGGQPACPSSEGICVHYLRDPPGVGECTPR